MQPAQTCATPLSTGCQLLPAGVGFNGSPFGTQPLFGPSKPQGNSSPTGSPSVSATAFEGEVLSLGQLLCLRGWALQISLCKPAAPSNAPLPESTDSVA